KSTGNYIGIDEPPNDVYGKVMSVPDTAILQYFTLATPVGPDEVDEIRAALEGERLPPMEAKKRLAREITASLFDAEAAQAAQDYFESTIQRKEVPDDLPEFGIGAPSPLHR